ncbi:helix-turn-helix domain-containing protein [Nesterenkonia ebinurensis]|uniref:helix-turn-helix domain-containing protein n=1 Tax=Nesterenkonia ebinurensis TaxID=2608252 RepID=UPI00123CC2DB
MNAARPDKHVVEDGAEVSRSLVDIFSRPTPALTRLIEHIRQNPELTESLAAGHSLTSSRCRYRQGRSTGEPNSGAGSTARRELTKQSRRTVSPGIEKARASVLLPLVVDYANGLTQAEIARKHGVHAQTLRKRLREAGVNTRVRVTALSESEVQATRAVISEGASVRAVARRLGVAHTTLLRALKRSSE